MVTNNLCHFHVASFYTSMNRKHQDHRRFKELRRELREDKWKIYLDVGLLVVLIVVVCIAIAKD